MSKLVEDCFDEACFDEACFDEACFDEAFPEKPFVGEFLRITDSSFPKRL